MLFFIVLKLSIKNNLETQSILLYADICFFFTKISVQTTQLRWCLSPWLIFSQFPTKTL